MDIYNIIRYMISLNLCNCYKHKQSLIIISIKNIELYKEDLGAVFLLVFLLQLFSGAIV